MKKLAYFPCLLIFCAIYLTSCSKESLDEIETADLSAKIAPVSYSAIEMDVLDLVNSYRKEKGLSELLYLDESSIQAAIHNKHMIEEDEVCHDSFGSRYEALVESVQAKSVSENVAFGFSTAEAVVEAWIKSEGHKLNMEGEHTHFGISVKEDKEGKLYFTNIFVKI